MHQTLMAALNCREYIAVTVPVPRILKQRVCISLNGLKVKKTFPGSVETVQPASRPQSAWFINNQSQYNPWHTVTLVHMCMYGTACGIH